MTLSCSKAWHNASCGIRMVNNTRVKLARIKPNIDASNFPRDEMVLIIEFHLFQV